jgi:hypothetical protein
MKITDVLARRTDLSTFLVHLTRTTADGQSAKQNLISIIEENVIEARSPFGAAVDLLDAAGQSTATQRCACFTETPLEHVSLLTHTLDEPRDIKFEPYGIAITRKQGRCLHVNPVWYLDMSPTGYDWLTNSVALIVKEAIARGAYTDSPMARLTPFMDWMGVWPNGNRKEFWWEREWRHPGHFFLPPTFIVLAPEADHQELDMIVNHVSPAKCVRFVDPAWSLEMIIGRLAGFEDKDLGPF